MTRFILVKSTLCLVMALCASSSTLLAEAFYSQPLDAKEMPIGNYLEWQTVTEIDVATFVVEKSTDGYSFYELGSVTGSGFSMVDKNYHFMDIGTSDKRNVYRLKEMSSDGTISYSMPTTVEKKMANNINVVAMSNVNVSNTFKLTADVMREGDLLCSLTDFGGKTLQQFNFKAYNGLNIIEINMENYQPGIYSFKVQLDAEVENITLRRVADERSTRPQVATTKKAAAGRQ